MCKEWCRLASQSHHPSPARRRGPRPRATCHNAGGEWGSLRGKAGSPPNPGEGSRAQLAAPWRGLGRHRGPRFRKRRRLRPPTYRLGRPARPRAALPFSGPSSLQTQRDTCRGLAPPDDFLKKSGLEILNLPPLPPPKICQDLMRLVGVLESDPLPASTRR